MILPLYPKIDAEELGQYYFRHLSGMTEEGLHLKCDIAVQLAWRDREIDMLRDRLMFPSPAQPAEAK